MLKPASLLETTTLRLFNIWVPVFFNAFSTLYKVSSRVYDVLCENSWQVWQGMGICWVGMPLLLNMVSFIAVRTFDWVHLTSSRCTIFFFSLAHDSCLLENQNLSNLLLTPSGLELQKWNTSRTRRSGEVWCRLVGPKVSMEKCLWHLRRGNEVTQSSRWVVILGTLGWGGARWGEGSESLPGGCGSVGMMGGKWECFPGTCRTVVDWPW